MQVFDPTGVSPVAVSSKGDWNIDVRGKTVGLLWNGKPNADNLLRTIDRRLKGTFGVADTMWFNKSEIAMGPGKPATEEILNRLAAGTVAVITGSGD